jgi:hypothetical protein
MTGGTFSWVVAGGGATMGGAMTGGAMTGGVPEVGSVDASSCRKSQNSCRGNVLL